MALEGNFQDMSLVDLLQVFQMGPKSGLLTVARPLERALVFVAGGRPIDAVLLQEPERQVITTGEDALLCLFLWEAGEFVFIHDMSVGAREAKIQRDSAALIVEGMRRREQARICTTTDSLTLDSSLRLAHGSFAADSSVQLDLNQWRVLSQVSICQNIREICSRASMAGPEALRIAAELVAVGLIDVLPPARPGNPPVHRIATPRIQAAQAAGGSGAQADTLQPSPAARPGKILLNAVMRRVRSL